jgi:hypothetical protein
MPRKKWSETPKCTRAFLESTCPQVTEIANPMGQTKARKQALMVSFANPRETSRESSRRPGKDRSQPIRNRCGGNAAFVEVFLDQDARLSETPGS